jgi:hypothetical protein
MTIDVHAVPTDVCTDDTMWDIGVLPLWQSDAHLAIDYEIWLAKFISDFNFKPIGQGGARRVFLMPSGKYVLKFPLNYNGETDNKREFEYYSMNPKNKARCRLIRMYDLPIIIMEVVTPWWKSDNDKHKSKSDMPKWVQSLDCAQAGYTRKGELVAYDYA